jgi:sucrose-6-phosphate hydrolase SacC (GH32 family)
MLLTTRHSGEAVIGLYTSGDLYEWTAQAPLYSEASPLNLEVPEFLLLESEGYLIYSDQRDESRQVRHLVHNAGTDAWEYPEYDALDGHAFYAARSAGPDSDRVLFGWVPHKFGYANSGVLRWGGDVVAHQVHKADDGTLAVSLPEKIKQTVTTASDWTPILEEGSVQINEATVTLGADSNFATASVNGVTRISAGLSGYTEGSAFGVQFVNSETDVRAFVEIDTQSETVSFFFKGDQNNPQVPRVTAPLTGAGSISIELLIDTDLEYGVLYVNDYRALTFRIYELKDYSVGFYSEDGLVISDMVRFE